MFDAYAGSRTLKLSCRLRTTSAKGLRPSPRERAPPQEEKTKHVKRTVDGSSSTEDKRRGRSWQMDETPRTSCHMTPPGVDEVCDRYRNERGTNGRTATNENENHWALDAPVSMYYAM